MRHLLKLHPDSRCDAAISIEAYVGRSPRGNLSLRYYLAGARNVANPAFAHYARADGLWQHTCFEAFLTTSPGDGYYEFNFSPSMAWAAYRFQAYRKDMKNADELDRPFIEMRRSAETFELRTDLKLAGLPNLPMDATWHLGLSAVIEETNGRKSYWALAHPPGKADFHHSDCFALALPAPLQP